jgi:protein tyrosine/serine phosphatase
MARSALDGVAVKLLCATALCLSVSAAAAQQAITTPIFTSPASDQNFRDLAGIAASMGGSGYADPAGHGGFMRTGVFYRSEALSASSLSQVDRATLRSLHITQDIDLRTPGEINGVASVMAPNAGVDQVIGAAYRNINIYGTQDPPSTTSVTTPDLAIAYMTTTYQDFVSGPDQPANFGTVLLAFAHGTGPFIYHCSGGKDRTGWTSMLLQSIAGVSPELIRQDYRATNIYMAGTIDAALQAIKAAADGGPVGDYAAAVAAPMLGVDDSYLQAGLAEVSAKFGSMDAYLKQGLGLSQTDIYVLRGKMVTYPELPGQNGFSGNAALGAAFLNGLQDSPLSGAYTQYNYYLQSAIDAGTLGGVETQAGGQVHADAASHLLRQPERLDGAIKPYASGHDLGIGETRVWLAGDGGYFWSDGHDGIASSAERNAGSIVGATHRIDSRTSVYAALGYDWGTVESAAAGANLGTALATFGGRYGFSTLDAGPFVAAHADAGSVAYRSKRALGGGLGTAQGRTDGVVYGGGGDIGDVIHVAPFTITQQVGFRLAQTELYSFHESGNELALAVDRIRQSSSAVSAEVDVSLDPQKLSDWTLRPSISLGYERALGNPQVESSASLYGFTVSQRSAYDGRNLGKAGVAFTAEHEAWRVSAGVDAVRGDASTGVSAQFSIGYGI